MQLNHKLLVFNATITYPKMQCRMTVRTDLCWYHPTWLADLLLLTLTIDIKLSRVYTSIPKFEYKDEAHKLPQCTVLPWNCTMTCTPRNPWTYQMSVSICEVSSLFVCSANLAKIMTSELTLINDLTAFFGKISMRYLLKKNPKRDWIIFVTFSKISFNI